MTPTFFLKNVFSWTRSSGRVKIRMFMFKIPDFSLAPRLCKQASLDLVSARKDFDPRTLVSGDLRHFDTTVRVQVTNVTFSLEIRLCRALCGNETPWRHNRPVSILDSTSWQTATACLLRGLYFEVCSIPLQLGQYIRCSPVFDSCTSGSGVRWPSLGCLHSYEFLATRATSIDLLPSYGPGTSKRYRKPVTTGNTVISNCEALLKLKNSCFFFTCLPLLVPIFFGRFAHKSAWQGFWWGFFLMCLFSDAWSCCIEILTKFPMA